MTRSRSALEFSDSGSGFGGTSGATVPPSTQNMVRYMVRSQPLGLVPAAAEQAIETGERSRGSLDVDQGRNITEREDRFKSKVLPQKHASLPGSESPTPTPVSTPELERGLQDKHQGNREHEGGPGTELAPLSQSCSDQPITLPLILERLLELGVLTYHPEHRSASLLSTPGLQAGVEEKLEDGVSGEGGNKAEIEMKDLEERVRVAEERVRGKVERAQFNNFAELTSTPSTDPPSTLHRAHHSLLDPAIMPHSVPGERPGSPAEELSMSPDAIAELDRQLENEMVDGEEETGTKEDGQTNGGGSLVAAKAGPDGGGAKVTESGHVEADKDKSAETEAEQTVLVMKNHSKDGEDKEEAAGSSAKDDSKKNGPLPNFSETHHGSRRCTFCGATSTPMRYPHKTYRRDVKKPATSTETSAPLESKASNLRSTSATVEAGSRKRGRDELDHNLEEAETRANKVAKKDLEGVERAPTFPMQKESKDIEREKESKKDGDRNPTSSSRAVNGSKAVSPPPEEGRSRRQLKTENARRSSDAGGVEKAVVKSKDALRKEIPPPFPLPQSQNRNVRVRSLMGEGRMEKTREDEKVDGKGSRIGAAEREKDEGESGKKSSRRSHPSTEVQHAIPSSEGSAKPSSSRIVPIDKSPNKLDGNPLPPPAPRPRNKGTQTIQTATLVPISPSPGLPKGVTLEHIFSCLFHSGVFSYTPLPVPTVPKLVPRSLTSHLPLSDIARTERIAQIEERMKAIEEWIAQMEKRAEARIVDKTMTDVVFAEPRKPPCKVLPSLQESKNLVDADLDRKMYDCDRGDSVPVGEGVVGQVLDVKVCLGSPDTPMLEAA
ncbi:hypothetical protein HDU93_000974 [Gonapodya sp. JEL0774]|nr:hypothetical protein HDU93_000974 [Gonapodya sp. JEL0774]